MDVVNLKEKFALFNDHWTPKIIGSLNGQDVKLAKVKGTFIWHDHKDEDELFMVIKGSLQIHFRDNIKVINEGEIMIVPRGVEHKPVADEECWILLFEPQSTKHTGEIDSELTVQTFDKI